MQEIVYFILRQMRRPALILLTSYSVAILGIVSIPAVDENGELTSLTFFQAFYWVSYTATTIGYGEMPFVFSEWQRIWVALSIYYTVPAWFYAIGKIIALLQDSTFQYALTVSRFQRNVLKINSKFCIICGFGEAGLRLTRLLLDEGYRCVVIERDQERLTKLMLDPTLESVLALHGEAENVELLEKAGIKSVHCRAVVAITDSEAVNMKVALAGRLLSSEHRYFRIACRTYTRMGNAQAKSLGVDITINTNRIFIEQLLTSLRRPTIAQLYARFTGIGGKTYEAPAQPPRGRWLICGNDSLGKYLKRALDYEGVDSVMIDPQLENSTDTVKGLGAETVTLREARIDRAQAIVTARNSDAENLAIALTAKSMHPSLFVVGKQNKSANKSLFAVAGLDRMMEEADLIVTKAFTLIARPVLSRFLALLLHQDEIWAKSLLKRLNTLCTETNPLHRLIRIDSNNAPAVIKEITAGRLLRMQSLWTSPSASESIQYALPLLLVRNNQEILLPDPATALQKDDKILIAYSQHATARRILANLRDEAQLYYTVHGKEKIRSPFFEHLLKRFG